MMSNTSNHRGDECILYDELGIERSKAGQSVGWALGSNIIQILTHSSK